MSRTTYNWQHVYLVRKEFNQSFDFIGFVDDVDKRISSRIEEDYQFHFETYLLNFKKEKCFFEPLYIMPILEHILFSEFEMSVDVHDSITFKRNTIKQVHKYSYEALEAIGQPSKVEAIYKKVVELHPGYDTDENSIRASMQRKNGFISFGRTSVYGLKIWEEEQDIRGGTIRDITEEYLLLQSEPKHIDEITEHVNKYRDTKAKNIYANLKMEDSSRFDFFIGSLIGLKRKEYKIKNLDKIEDRQIIRRSWEDNFAILENFSVDHGRLPYSTRTEYEKKLYRFMVLQLKKARQGKLDENRTRRIKAFADSYNYGRRVRKASKNVNSSYDKLKDFVFTYKRLPSARNVKERNLYHFYYRQTTLFKKGALSWEKKAKYTEIKKLIQTIYEN